jgi:hypothetical protein
MRHAARSEIFPGAGFSKQLVNGCLKDRQYGENLLFQSGPAFFRE